MAFHSAVDMLAAGATGFAGGVAGHLLWPRLQGRFPMLRTLQQPKRIILLRHGQSAGNVDRTLFARLPDPEHPLTDLGLAQARDAGVKLKALVGDEKVTFLVSPYVRTKQTFQQVVASFDPKQYHSQLEPQLREQEWGMFQAPEQMEHILRERARVGQYYYRFPRGESGADVFDRMSALMETLHRGWQRYPDSFRNVILVSHGLAVRLFLMRWFHWDVETFNSLVSVTNGGFYIMEKQPSGDYLLSTPVATTKPDNIRKYFAPGVHPYTPAPKAVPAAGQSGPSN